MKIVNGVRINRISDEALFDVKKRNRDAVAPEEELEHKRATIERLSVAFFGACYDCGKHECSCGKQKIGFDPSTGTPFASGCKMCGEKTKHNVCRKCLADLRQKGTYICMRCLRRRNENMFGVLKSGNRSYVCKECRKRQRKGLAVR